MRKNQLLLVLFSISLISKSECEILDNDDDIPVVEGSGIINIKEENDVLILNADNFDHVISSRSVVLVEFYAPWCGHCKALDPEYAAAAKDLKKDAIQIAKVDATVEEVLAKRYEITGYPTLKLFKKGQTEPEEFDGARTRQGIIEYMRKHADPNYEPPPSAVEDLDGESFPEFIEEHPLSLVEFFAPWCGHCKSLAPEYEAAALDLKSHGIPLAKVDAIDQKDLASEYKVTGYPTLFIFRHGRKYDYKGPRDRTGIVAYMKEHAKSPSTEVSSLLQAKNLSPRTSPFVFSAFSSDSEEFFKEYLSAANEMREQMTFLHTYDTNLAKNFGISTNAINIIIPEIYQSQFEPKIHSFTKDEAKSSEILKWIEKQSIPLVGERSKSNMALKYEKRPLLVVYYDVNFDYQYVKDTQFIRNKILPVANLHKDFHFAISDETEFMDELKLLGLDDSGEEVNAAIFDHKGLRYPMEPDEFSQDLLEDFVLKYKKGLLKPHHKSKPIPKRQEGPVQVVVANNFDDALLQNEKDVLIEFYAPWCGHCKSLEPVYKQIAQSCLTSHPNLIVAKMDATANDVMSIFEVKGFPTIFFLQGTDKASPILFDSERNFDGLMNFIEQYSTDTYMRDEL